MKIRVNPLNLCHQWSINAISDLTQEQTHKLNR